MHELSYEGEKYSRHGKITGAEAGGNMHEHQVEQKGLRNQLKKVNSKSGENRNNYRNYITKYILHIAVHLNLKSEIHFCKLDILGKKFIRNLFSII